MFGRLLRRAGLAVDPDQTRTFTQALGLLGVARKGDVRAAGRAIYVRRREDRPTFDEAFELFWRRRAYGSALAGRLPRLVQSERRPGGLDLSADTGLGAERRAPVEILVPRGSSSLERLRLADFGELTAAEERDALRMISALRPRLPLRPARRGRVARHGGRLAMRRMLRRSLATGGQPLAWRWIRRTRRPRPIILICDISGSMERYSRFLLRFAHALARSGAPVEVFVFGTRLTRITRQLRVRSADEALRRVAHTVVDWSGGTRIGESLRELNLRWARRTIRSGAVALLVSDGWERGDPALLEREMARLNRNTHRLVWLDPLASRAGFEPLTQGLVAALPHVDDFLPCANIASLERLAVVLGGVQQGSGKAVAQSIRTSLTPPRTSRPGTPPPP
ncbi:MAG: VWA domain-containing protein [Gemmatimonadetes bacterium]|nr:VWA domain-containing protein [Gemmatimonadota bacterium]MBK7715608.1 VWA domain-containing protein [Gemmatimonadota bacterium]MBK7925579.1 VWA domain-containing protein [Gemmatimonadota bacterium]MBK9691158.1 VWA domain-containing protein [Gemmatimonadota bacterium]